ncbi:LacI family DNA-binding transcriptional regulator [Bifidobacterium jacchi]|uniref:LacI family transcriptional regulator n=1 Tax=Bifidobacterium jacchi TaxID=2490545 RepID=A0A5N5RNJ8_9BIFI|nr:LacI family DNA-binding transcriptional regulator [Bifidobacterium jacchi]KAB5608540.1 LacI family transcriptional regulator [Bifidobacterium jacchi]
MSSTSSITDVAVLAKVSKATVSRVLSGRRAKDDDIARRVKDAADQLNYQMNAAASALRSNTTTTIGLIAADPTDAFTAHMLAELEPMVNDDGRQLLIGIGADAQTQADRIEAMLGRQVDGIAVIPPKHNSELPDLDRYVGRVPLVQIGGPTGALHVNWVGVDETATIKLMLAHMAAHNARSIAFLSGDIDTDAAAQRFGTFQPSISTLGLMTQPGWTTVGDTTIARGYADAMRLFAAPGGGSSSRRSERDTPEGVICATDDVAIGVLMALNQLSVGVPDEVKVAGSGDAPICAAAKPSLTSTRPPYHLIARETMRLLNASSGKQHWLPAHVAFPQQLVQRDSTSSPRLGSSNMTSEEDEE